MSKPYYYYYLNRDTLEKQLIPPNQATHKPPAVPKIASKKTVARVQKKLKNRPPESRHAQRHGFHWITIYLIAAVAFRTCFTSFFDPKPRTTALQGQPCGQFWHKHTVVHRKSIRRPVIPVVQTPGAGWNAHTCLFCKCLKAKEIFVLSTQNGKPYYDYYVFIETLRNNKEPKPNSSGETPPDTGSTKSKGHTTCAEGGTAL